MFQIEPKTLKDYVTDNSIKMPRFQRSEVWKDDQKFDLLLSICKQYPIGSVILCGESNPKTGTIDKWLIDGRQRYSTTRQIMMSPDLIWIWAKKALHVNDKTPDEDIVDKFIEYLEDYTNYDKSEHEGEPIVVTVDEPEDTTDEDDNSQELYGSHQPDYSSNLSLTMQTNRLLDLILFCKNNRKGKNYGMTNVFDFSNYIREKKLVKFENSFYEPGGKKIISGEKVRAFLDRYKSWCGRERDPKEKANFVDFIEDEYEFKDDKARTKYETTVMSFWNEKQLTAMELYEWAESLLSNSFVGVITVTNASAADELKIFQLINSNGTPLNPAQILSAKPAWNEPIYGLDTQRKDSIKRVYQYLHNDDVDFENCVKWDLPACLFTEIKNGDILYPFSDYQNDDKKIGKAITLGFKILSGIYLGKVTKEAYDELGSNKHMNNSDFSEFVVCFNEMLVKMAGMTYFKTLSSWKLCLSTLIGENATTYFTMAAYHMYMAANRPSAGSLQFKLFEKNLFILLDRIIYEYLNSMWRGSSDSILQSKMKELKNNYKPNALLEYIPTDKWTELIDSVMADGTIASKEIKFDLMKPLVAHYYCIKGLRCTVTYEYTSEFDHIIPQKSFNASAMEKKELRRDSVFNLGLLPKSANASKNDRTLNEITDNQSLKSAVVEYEEVPEERFNEYSNVSGWESLRDFRGQKVRDAFAKIRQATLNNG